MRILGYQADYPDDLTDEERDKIYDGLLTAFDPDHQFSYMHVSRVERMIENAIKEGEFPESGAGGYPVRSVVSVRESDAYEELVEDFRCNEGSW